MVTSFYDIGDWILLPIYSALEQGDCIAGIILHIDQVSGQLGVERHIPAFSDKDPALH